MSDEFIKGALYTCSSDNCSCVIEYLGNGRGYIIEDTAIEGNIGEIEHMYLGGWTQLEYTTSPLWKLMNL
jgi:hypothetical protein